MSGYICENCMAVDPKDGAFNGCLACQSLARSEIESMPAAHPLPTPRRFQPTTVGNMAVDKNGGYVSVDDYDLLEREAAELRRLNSGLVAAGRTSLARYDALKERSDADIAELRAQLAEVKEALAGDDYASLPSDYPLVRMAHTIRADHDKFRNQVIDTCTRAETAERQRDEALKDAERYRWVLPILTGEGHEGDKRALAIAAQLVNGLTGSAAIDAAKEKSNG